MQDLLSKLVSLLDHKNYVLGELIKGQERFRDFLMQPDKRALNDVMAPQQDLLIKLRQIQAAQDYLLTELARELGAQKITTLRALCRMLDLEWQQAILACIGRIEESVGRLQKLSRMSAALNQAEHRFQRNCLGEAGAAPPATHVYNAHGYTRPTFDAGFVSREV